MLERIREEWRRFAAEPSGSRFERHYERKRAQETGVVQRCIWILAGIFFMLAGFVMLFTPGPGLLALGFGATCFAQESRRVARLCDRADVRLTRAWERWRRRGP